MTNYLIDQLKIISEKANCFEAKSLIEYAANQNNGKFHLLILGEFKRGKSSMVNKLLDFDLIPSDILPCTATINIIEYGSPSLSIHYKSGQVLNLPFEANALRPYTAESSENVDDIAYIKIKVNHPFLEDGLVIIDTPGVNDISQSRVEITKQVLPNADAALFLLDSHAPVTKSEVHFLKSQVYSNSIQQITFVISKADRLDEDELEEVMEGSKKRLKEVLNIDANIIPFSIKDSKYQTEMINSITNLIKMSKDDYEARSNERLLLATELLIETITEQIANLSLDEEAANKKKIAYNQEIKQYELMYYEFSKNAKLIGEPVLIKMMQVSIEKFRTRVIKAFTYKIETASDVMILQNNLAIDMEYQMKALTDYCSKEINNYLIKTREHIAKEYSRNFHGSVNSNHDVVIINETRTEKPVGDKISQTIENIVPVSLGLVVGSIILPGIGTIIGSAVGQVVGVALHNSKNETLRKNLLEELPRFVDSVIIPFENQVLETISDQFNHLHESINTFHEQKNETKRHQLPLLLSDNKNDHKEQLQSYLQTLKNLKLEQEDLNVRLFNEFV